MPKSTGEIAPLTFVRFFAAILVVAFHYARSVLPHGAIYNIIDGGYSGVSLFFVLSGFILTYVYDSQDFKRPVDLWQFAVRRFARIYPVYLFAWALVLASFLVEEPLTPYALKTHAFFGGLSLILVQSWIPGVVQHWNWPSWSICAEALFYSTFPFIMMACRRLSDRALPWLFVGALAVNYIVGCWIAGLDGNVLVGSALETGLRGYVGDLPLTQMPLFVMGVALAKAYLRGFRVPWAPAWLALMSIAILLTLSVGRIHLGPFSRDVALAPEFCALVFLLATIPARTPGPVGRLGLLLGRASYALYIIQSPITGIYWRLLGHRMDHASPSEVAILMLLLVVASVVVHVSIEVPAERAIKRWALWQNAPAVPFQRRGVVGITVGRDP